MINYGKAQKTASNIFTTGQQNLEKIAVCGDCPNISANTFYFERSLPVLSKSKDVGLFCTLRNAVTLISNFKDGLKFSMIQKCR